MTPVNNKKAAVIKKTVYLKKSRRSNSQHAMKYRTLTATTAVTYYKVSKSSLQGMGMKNWATLLSKKLMSKMVTIYYDMKVFLK